MSFTKGTTTIRSRIFQSVSKYVRFTAVYGQFAYISNRNMDLKSVVQTLEKFASPKLAESWDNVGLLVEPSSKSVSSILLTNDLTETVLSEAVELNTDMIVSYHPPIFSSLKRLNQHNFKQRIILKCIENKIAVYSPHTSYDAMAGGINDWLISVFDIEADSSAPVVPINSVQDFVALDKSKLSSQELSTLTAQFPDEVCSGKPFVYLKKHQWSRVTELVQPDHIWCFPVKQEGKDMCGMGRTARLKKQYKIAEIIEKVKTHVGVKYIRVALGEGKSIDSEISSVAVCAGSGASVLGGCDVDLYLTGEMSHHDVLEAVSEGCTVILCEHSNSERGFLLLVQKYLQEEFGNTLKVDISKVDRDPITIV